MFLISLLLLMIHVNAVDVAQAPVVEPFDYAAAMQSCSGIPSPARESCEAEAEERKEKHTQQNCNLKTWDISKECSTAFGNAQESLRLASSISSKLVSDVVGLCNKTCSAASIRSRMSECRADQIQKILDNDAHNFYEKAPSKTIASIQCGIPNEDAQKDIKIRQDFADAGVNVGEYNDNGETTHEDITENKIRYDRTCKETINGPKVCVDVPYNGGVVNTPALYKDSENIYHSTLTSAIGNQNSDTCKATLSAAKCSETFKEVIPGGATRTVKRQATGFGNLYDSTMQCRQATGGRELCTYESNGAMTYAFRNESTGALDIISNHTQIASVPQPVVTPDPVIPIQQRPVTPVVTRTTPVTPVQRTQPIQQTPVNQQQQPQVQASNTETANTTAGNNGGANNGGNNNGGGSSGGSSGGASNGGGSSGGSSGESSFDSNPYSPMSNLPKTNTNFSGGNLNEVASGSGSGAGSFGQSGTGLVAGTYNGNGASAKAHQANGVGSETTSSADGSMNVASLGAGARGISSAANPNALTGANKTGAVANPDGLIFPKIKLGGEEFYNVPKGLTGAARAKAIAQAKAKGVKPKGRNGRAGLQTASIDACTGGKIKCFLSSLIASKETQARPKRAPRLRVADTNYYTGGQQSRLPAGVGRGISPVFQGLEQFHNNMPLDENGFLDVTDI